ncbi:MAG: DUF2796 domain-containing protein [Geminicoccaceae bacterium]
MRTWITGGLLAALAWTAHAEERRELGAHEHGHARLNLAIEGSALALEIEAPGMDVLGFEHPARSEQDKAAVEAAKATLADPLALFVPPTAAGCRAVEAAVDLLQEAHEGESHTDHSDEPPHSEFRGRYAVECGDPDALSQLAFIWFDRFPNARAVTVTVLDVRGQSSREVERGDPPLAIGAGS